MKLTKEFVREEIERFANEPKRYKAEENIRGTFAITCVNNPATGNIECITFGTPDDRVLELERMGINWREYCELWIEILIENGDNPFKKLTSMNRSSKHEGNRKQLPLIIIDPPMNHGNWKSI